MGGYGKGKPAQVQFNSSTSRSYGAPAYGQNAKVLPVFTVMLTEESQLTQQGFPPEAPCMSYEKGDTAFSSATHILGDLVGDISTEVEIHHDPDWENFPEVAAAVKAASGEENCYGVATCPKEGKWAVGIGSGWKSRESSCKLALAYAIAVDKDTQTLDWISKTYPEFGDVLAENGIIGGRGPRKGQGKQWAQPAQPAQPAWQPQQQTFQAGGASLQGGGPEMLQISIGRDSRLVQDGFPPSAVCVYHDKTHSDMFREGGYVLGEAIGDLKEDVIFNHDPDWDVLPEIGAAIKQAGAEEDCYCVATLPSKGVWAVGLAGGWKNRESAAKLALSLTLYPCGSDELQQMSAKYPSFGACANSGASSGGPAQKRRRVQAPPEPNPASFARPVPKSGSKGAPPEPASKGLQGSKGKGKDSQGGKGFGGKGDKSNGKKGGKSFGTPLPRDSPLWIQLSPEKPVPDLLQDVGIDAIAVACDTNFAANPLFGSADSVLEQLVADPQADVVYHDDAARKMFPEISEALKLHADGQEPFQVAVCFNLCTWGVGVGPTEACRIAASKVALASMLTLRAAETGEVPDLEAFPDFSEFVASITPPS
eukprot:TRINITY_DN110495_c0_g1_i1.p1 TRINITY_DN110495_c0_g1~~TRINITY_DN110495_c0_g1_i1.p1  ORF type:complete len:594 (+),score=133.46 TRINITY_DN110495_c0_g1_i1:89-1870(+)